MKMTRLALLTLTALVSWGCQATQPAPTATPTVAVNTPLATASAKPGMHTVERLQKVIERYEASQEGPWGLKELESCLKWPGLEELELESSKGLKDFDEELLPGIRRAFSCQAFLPPQPLLAGHPPVDYRGIRKLAQLTVQRSELYWNQGAREKALELWELPLSLADSFGRRPETVSVNLFSLNYAQASLSLLQNWLSSGQMDRQTLDSVGQALARHRPNYDHLRETFTVDIAQLFNSLEHEEASQALGLSKSSAEQVELWKSELLSLYELGDQLYALPGAPDAQKFNKAVLSASPQLQGLIIDYPHIVTMQKHGHLNYLCAELALALERARLDGGGGKLSEVATATFSNPSTVETLEQLVTYQAEPDGKSFRLLAKDNTFELLGPEVVFFQKLPTAGTAEPRKSSTKGSP